MKENILICGIGAVGSIYAEKIQKYSFFYKVIQHSQISPCFQTKNVIISALGESIREGLMKSFWLKYTATWFGSGLSPKAPGTAGSLATLPFVYALALVGGWQGGLAGSVGMGLYDILGGHIDSAPKTFVLKLLIGLATGIVYALLAKRKKYPAVPLYISGVVSLMAATGLLVYTLVKNSAYTGEGAVLSPIFFVIGILCIVFGFLKNKFSHKTAAAVVGASCGMLVNIVGETAWKFVSYVIAGSAPQAAFVTAVLGQASTLINAGIAIAGGVALFCALEKPFSKILGK